MIRPCPDPGPVQAMRKRKETPWCSASKVPPSGARHSKLFENTSSENVTGCWALVSALSKLASPE